MPHYDNHPRSFHDQGDENELGLNIWVQTLPVFVFLINTSLTLLQIKYNNIQDGASPFETHYGIMVAFSVSVHLYALLPFIIIMRPSAIPKISKLCGALASILLLLILVPSFGWFSLVVWMICFVKEVHNSYQEYRRLFYHATLHVLDILMNLLMRRRLHQQYQLPL
ncbi:hypothetical protein QYF36_005361 [Acer negundo]|nr:hypothetical protein QYF36_005361 [Acer negundo]